MPVIFIPCMMMSIIPTSEPQRTQFISHVSRHYVIAYLSVVLIKVINVDYGMEDKNPIDRVHFYCKSNSKQAVRINKEQVMVT